MVQTTAAERVPEAVQTKGETALRAYRVAFAMFADRSLAEAVATKVASKYLRIHGATPPNTPRLRDIVDEFATAAATAAVYAKALCEARRARAGDDAQDLAHSTVLAVMSSYRMDRDDTNLDGFIVKTIQHSMINAHRHRKVESCSVSTLTMLLPPSPDPMQSAVLRQLGSVLSEGLKQLPDAERTIVLGHCLNGESLSDIARTSGMDLGEVQRCLRSGLAHLRSALAGLDSGAVLPLAERIQRVEAALDNLDPTDRDVLLRWIMGGLTEAELVLRTGASKRQLKRAQHNLRQQLDKSRWASRPSGYLDDVRRLAEESPAVADVFLAVEFEGKTTDDLVPSRGTRHQVSALRKRARASLEARRKQ
jgi:RNA polymerase sigma factor (sigma-70 family)